MAFAGTPGRLRLVALGVIFGCLIAGFGGAWALSSRSSALGDARDTTQHLLRVQRVQTNLLQADALITNTFLQGGLENTEQLTAYYQAVDAAAGDLAMAARASDADADVLSRANTALSQYTGLVEAARANNRQGNPVGANYLKEATSLLTDQVIKPVDDRATADSRAIDSALNGAQNARWLLLGFAVIGLGLLAYSLFVLAMTTRRFVNLPAAGAGAVLVVVLLLAAVVMAGVQNKASNTRDGAYADTIQLSDARVAAFQAKANESLALITRGSGTQINKGSNTAADPGWDALYEKAGQIPSAADGALSDLSAYADQHKRIRAADDDGDWDAAVTLAVSTTKGSVNAAFNAYTTKTEDVLDQTSAQAADGFKAGPALSIVAVLLLLAGIGAAIVGYVGVSERLGEYR